MHRRTAWALLVAVVLFSGCGKKSKSEPGVGEWQRIGECGVKIESVSYGKVKGKGMFGPGESSEKLLIIRTQFRNLDKSVEVKHSPWMSDSTMMTVGISLTDDMGDKGDKGTR